MKRKITFVFLALALLLVGSMLGCNLTKTGNELSNDMEIVKNLWLSLSLYKADLEEAATIRNESLAQAESALHNGNITTYEFRQRVYEIYLIEANTIKFIDNKLEYAELNSFMWPAGEPPTLAWCIPEAQSDPERREAEFEEYLQGYIVYHHDIADELSQFLMEQADELGIDTTHLPEL